MKDVMIRVPDTVRDRLAVLAEARSLSIRALLQEFAESTLTPEEREERAAEARRYISEHFGVLVSDADETAVQRSIDAAFHRANATGATGTAMTPEADTTTATATTNEIRDAA
ncbi:hypothetical protein ACIBJC_14340 [Streptomyces sp. NPDC050509]|uniref:hypothetical protein n=1 Tax=Streptomyces sp. NPDC050509 TaxID=3365620 RepID=UPI0037B097E6